MTLWSVAGKQDRKGKEITSTIYNFKLDPFFHQDLLDFYLFFALFAGQVIELISFLWKSFNSLCSVADYHPEKSSFQLMEFRKMHFTVGAVVD